MEKLCAFLDVYGELLLSLRNMQELACKYSE